MAFEVLKEIPCVHEDVVCAIAFDRAKKTVYTVAEGDKAVKVGPLRAWHALGGAWGLAAGRAAAPHARCAAPLRCAAARCPPPRAPRPRRRPTAAPRPPRRLPLQAWDLKSGALLRTQVAHRGVATNVVYAHAPRLLFSASVDGAVGVWTDKGTLLQVRGRRGDHFRPAVSPEAAARSRQTGGQQRGLPSRPARALCPSPAQLVPTGSPLFSLAWSNQLRLLVAGGHSILHVFRVDAAEATRLRHTRNAATGGGSGGRSAGGGAAAGGGAGAAATAAVIHGDERPVLVRVCPPFRGWRHPSAAGSSGRPSRSAASSEPRQGSSLPSTAAGGAQRSSSGDAAATPDGAAEAGGSHAVDAAWLGGGSAGGGGAAAAAASAAAADQGVVLAGRGTREEDYFAACHTDIVKCIVVADSGKIFTAG
jgi:hypothetical protein